MAPTSPVNGDIWTTTSGLFANINSAVKQFPTLSDGNNFSGNNTFSGTTLIFGNSAELSTVNIGTGANAEDITKNVNIATNGALGSTTNVRMGPTAGLSSIFLGQSTATSTVNIGTGATVNQSNKFVNIATNGAAESTTEVRIGPTAGLGSIFLGQSTATSTVNIGTGATVDQSDKFVNIATAGALGSTTEVKIGPIAGESSMTFGQSTVDSDVQIGTGTTVADSTKKINIGTGGLSGSTTEVKIGPTAGLGFITLGQSTAASTVNIGTGATVSGSIKAVYIGTGGVAGSTTNTTIGTTSGGGNSVTINGPTTFGGPAFFNGNTFTMSGTDPIIGNSAATSNINIGTGLTANTLTKTVNIGTNGAAGSTTNVTIGSATGASTTKINGRVQMQHYYTSTATALMLTASHRYVVVTAGVLITLPSASTVAGTVYTINARAANVTISTYKNLSGIDTTGIANGTSIEIISDGANWQQVK